ncbi:MAG: ABC transporter permease [Thermoanaerobaculia bacterium]|nr:ABC transporter permease [Thermoanaerobaculia bacterium]
MKSLAAVRSFLDAQSQDLRFALRTLARSPGYAITVVVTLGLAIGANSAIFSLVDGVLLRDLPYEHNDRLVVLEAQNPKRQATQTRFSVQEMHELRQRVHTLDEVVEHHAMSFILLGRDEPRRVSTGVVSANFFDVLGVGPQVGRLFRADDETHEADPVLVLSWEFWQQAFGGDDGIVGQVFEMNDRPHQVVGVLPPIPQWPARHDVYMPTVACPFRARGNEMRHENRNAFRSLSIFGRLAEGKDLQAAVREMDGIAATWREEHPEAYREEDGFSVATSRLDERLGRGARSTLGMLLATAALVLLIACANVANLGVARLLARRRELAVRGALGAGRRRLLGQLLTESTVLALAGSVFGLFVAYRSLDILARFVARYSPRAMDVALDLRVVAFTAVIAVAAGIAAGSLPLLSFSARRRLADALRDGTRSGDGVGRSRLRAFLITAQVAASVILLAAAGLFLDSMWRLQQVDLGFETERIITAEIPLNWSQLGSAEERRPYLERIETAVAGVPGVSSVALGNVIPLAEQTPMQFRLLTEEQGAIDPNGGPEVEFRIAGKDYFQTLGIALQEGRTFADSDTEDSQDVLIIDRRAAHQLFPDRPALGQRVSADQGRTWVEIVGIVASTRQNRADETPKPTVYQNPRQSGFADSLFLRTDREPGALARDLKAAIWHVAPDQVVAEIRTLEELRRNSTAAPRTITILVSLFAGLALLITIAGVAGIVAHGVGRRRREIGVRMALGAQRLEVLRLVLAQALTLVAAGLVVGLVGAIAGGRSLAPFLFESAGVDWRVLGGVVLTMLLTAFLACWLPALKALGVEPSSALRSE